ncbi:hypothetical protein MYEC719_p20036 (plasmid) [Escherichia coli]|nr:hypothetical protein [Escherichia coli]BCL10842.1 hypothetical protein MYEC719_p20036 [Escherichia coli]
MEAIVEADRWFSWQATGFRRPHWRYAKGNQPPGAQASASLQR